MRQITYDDKGLTSIFVFGLSGSDSGDHPARAVLAAAEVMKLVQGSGMGTWTSGISTGFCFCGPIGSLQVRCEYVIMGGEPGAVGDASAAGCRPSPLALAGCGLSKLDGFRVALLGSPT